MRIDTSHFLSRRTFLKSLALGLPALGALRLLESCGPQDPLSHITGGIIGADHKTGHLLRHPEQLPRPSATVETDVLIVGGGISGLSARRWLEQHTAAKVLLVEMDTEPGGNSRYGRNSVSAYPYGAHYLPVPDVRNRELIDFLAGCGVITGFNAAGLPRYNEYHLCHDPEERLFINGYWQEGLVPLTGISAADRQQTERFFARMETLKRQKGNDGKDAFAIPLNHSSTDAAFARLHDISFAQYLDEEGFTAAPLRWYLEYGCKDDYGTDLAHTSAWAGLHYFAARKGTAANAEASSVLTWPEGNGFLMEALKKEGRGEIRSQSLVYGVQREGAGVTAQCYDVARGSSYAVKARRLLLATPVFVNRQLLKSEPAYREIDFDAFRHAPWVVANLTLKGLPQGKGAPLCWDNVLYGTASVGYINASHQLLTEGTQKVITFYLPLTGDDPGRVRREAYSRPYRYWLEKIVAELRPAHPGMEQYITHADFWIWGHGMIAPGPGFINGAARRQAAAPIGDQVFFAHTDLSGISIFEEAFYGGIGAADQILNVL